MNCKLNEVLKVKHFAQIVISQLQFTVNKMVRNIHKKTNSTDINQSRSIAQITTGNNKDSVFYSFSLFSFLA